ncbi:MAG: alpha/beta fold hydrolase, partial [Aggregatilineales bacterium]
DVQWDSDGKTLVHVERRASGSVLVATSDDGASRNLTDSSLSVSGRVGYGGGEFTVTNGTVIYTAGGRLYTMALNSGSAKPLIPGFGAAASPCISVDGKWVVFVHTYEGVDGLAIVDRAGELFPRKLAYGDDFAMQPAWHPHGTHLAYIAWNHPQMPWLGTELRLLTLAYDTSGVPYAPISETLTGDENTSIFQPEFSSDGRYLAYISDASGFTHLYLYDIGEGTHTQITDGDFEVGTPGWVQGLRQYMWSSDNNKIYYIRNQNASHTLWYYDLKAQQSTQIDVAPYTYLQQISVSSDDNIALLASANNIPARVITLSEDSAPTVRRYASTERLAPSQLSVSDHLTWQDEKGDDVHGLYYAPVSETVTGMGVPPLMVLVHGGPTSQRFMNYDNEVQFFTTRGYAVLQVNHRGGTGYGRAYMDRHAGNWGIYDVQDSISGAQHLVDKELADASRLVIMGGSAGGFTVLQALIEHPGFFKAGICSYGVSNQFSLLLDTHKFEARYSDWLLGALPDAADTWRERSPQFRANEIVDAMLIFQGTDDNVVPKAQSDGIVAALKRSGVPHDYIVYEGEGHGWRKPDTIKDFYTKIERFLLQYVIYT